MGKLEDDIKANIAAVKGNAARFEQQKARQPQSGPREIGYREVEKLDERGKPAGKLIVEKISKSDHEKMIEDFIVKLRSLN